MLTSIVFPVPETVEQITIQPLPLYRVILHNDMIHFVHEVIEALVKSVPLTTQEAEQITLTAHKEGRAVVIECNKEAAEYYQERLGTYGLMVTIEPA